MPDTMILARTIYLKINSRPATVYVLSFNFTQQYVAQEQMGQALKLD